MSFRPPLLSLLFLAAVTTVAAAGEPEHAVVRVEGMTCAGCNKTVTTALEALPFLKSVHASFAAKGACAELTGPLDEAQVRAAIETSGYRFVSVEAVDACPDDLRGPLPEPWAKWSDGRDVAHHATRSQGSASASSGAKVP